MTHDEFVSFEDFFHAMQPERELVSGNSMSIRDAVWLISQLYDNGIMLPEHCLNVRFAPSDLYDIADMAEGDLLLVWPALNREQRCAINWIRNSETLF